MGLAVIEGQWQLTGDGITGWAIDSASSRPLWVELLADDICYGVALAELQEPHVGGFFLRLPPVLLEESAQLQIRVANSDIVLPQTQPENVSAESAALVPSDKLLGELTVDRGLRISGWVLDPARTDEKLHIFANINGQTVAEAVAAERLYRPAMADGHGFGLELPLTFADGHSHVVQLRDAKGRELPGSPLRIRTLQQKTGDWLRQQKNVGKPLLDMVANLLDTMEERLPGTLAQGNYVLYKKAFPLGQPSTKMRLAVQSAPPTLLKDQQGCDIRAGKDFVFLPGNAKNLHKYALAQLGAAWQSTGADLIYADGESAAGEPLFKGAWDREAFLARDYLGPCLIRNEILQKAGIVGPIITEADRFKAIMAAAELGKIAHLPLPLYVGDILPPSQERIEAVNRWLATKYPGSSYRPGAMAYGTVAQPLISIIIPTRDHGDLLETCLNSLYTTSWPNFEILIIDNGTVEDKALSIMAQAKTRDNVCVLRRPGVFDYAALNNEAVQHARGEYICFLNNDTEALHPQWLGELASLLGMMGEEAGAVGAKLLWPNGLVQHGGVVVGTHQLAAHIGNHWLDDEPGYMGMNNIARRCSVVTAACMLTPRQLFLENGGFDGRRFPIAFNDVDYCLRIGTLGKQILWTPQARLAHHESASRGKERSPSAKARAEREMKAFRALWGHFDDPFYNPNLTLSVASEPFAGLAFPPRRRAPRIA